MNIHTLKENMRRFKTKNVLFEALDPKAETHWSANPLPDWAEHKFRQYLNKGSNAAIYGPGTPFDIEYPKPDGQPPLNDFVKAAWYDLSINPKMTTLYNNMLKNDFALLKRPDPKPVPLKTVNQKTYNIMSIRKPGPLKPNQDPIENPKDLRIIQRGTIDPDTGKQSPTEYYIVGVVGQGWKLNSGIGTITKAEAGNWHWEVSTEIGTTKGWGSRFIGKLGFSRKVDADDPDHQRMDQSGRHFPDPIEGGLKFYGPRDRAYAGTIRSTGTSYLRGVDVGIDEVNNLLVTKLGALFNSNITKNAIQLA